MSIKDKIIVFSGFRDDNLKAQIEKVGAKVASTLVKNANILIVKNASKASKKIDEAKAKNMEIIELEEFIKNHNFEIGVKESKMEVKDSKDGMVLIHNIMTTLIHKKDKKQALQALEDLKNIIANLE